MSFIDKADLKTGFWLGLGVILALMAATFAQVLVMKARGTRDG